MYAAVKYNLPLRRYWREKKRLSRSRKAAASEQAHVRSTTILLPPDSDITATAIAQESIPDSALAAIALQSMQDTPPAAIALQSIPDSAPAASGEQETCPILLTDDYAQNFLDGSEPTSSWSPDSDQPFGDPPDGGLDPAPDPLPGADPGGKVGHVKDTSADTSTDTSIDTSRDMSAEKSMKRGKKRRRLIKHIDLETGTLTDCLTPGAKIASSPSPNDPSPPETHPTELDPPGAERPGGARAPAFLPGEPDRLAAAPPGGCEGKSAIRAAPIRPWQSQSKGHPAALRRRITPPGRTGSPAAASILPAAAAESPPQNPRHSLHPPCCISYIATRRST